MLRKFFYTSLYFVWSCNAIAQNISIEDLPIVKAKSASTATSTSTSTIVIEAPPAFKITKVIFDGINSIKTFGVFTAVNTAPFCKNSSGGPGLEPYAYVDMTDPNAKLLIAGLMQAYQENKLVRLRVNSVLDTTTGLTICKINYFTTLY